MRIEGTVEPIEPVRAAAFGGVREHPRREEGRTKRPVESTLGEGSIPAGGTDRLVRIRWEDWMNAILFRLSHPTQRFH